MLITSGLTPVTDPEVTTAATPLVPCKTEWIKPAQDQLVTVPLVEVHIQPCADNKLGRSYITEAQVTQVENVSCNTSNSNSDALPQEYLKNHLMSG